MLAGTPLQFERAHPTAIWQTTTEGHFMPHSTAKFHFELKVLGWASHFSRTMTGENRGFLITLDSGGAVHRIFFGTGPRHFDLTLKESLTKSNHCWIFYHPFDAPEYIWIEWQNVQRNVIERLIGTHLNETDFTDFVGMNERIEYPISWQVMF